MMRGSAILNSICVAPGPNSIEIIPSHHPKLASVNGSRCSRVSESPLRTMCNPRMLVTSRCPESTSILIISEQCVPRRQELIVQRSTFPEDYFQQVHELETTRRRHACLIMI